MHPLFSYEEARKLDVLRAAHASDPIHSSFRTHRRPLAKGLRSLRRRLRRDVIIDIRTPTARLADRPALPEFLEVPDVPDIVLAPGGGNLVSATKLE